MVTQIEKLNQGVTISCAFSAHHSLPPLSLPQGILLLSKHSMS